MLRRIAIIAMMGLLISSLTQVHAYASAEYSPGYGALDVFNGPGMAATPLWIKVWFAVMVATFASGLAFIRRHTSARLAVCGFLLPFLIAGPIFKALGLPFLGGSIAIAHLVFWTPALVVLLLRRPFFDSTKGTGFRIWSGAMTGVILFSFIFDIRDAVIYSSHFIGS
jgi:hypothetical protein